MTEKTTAYDPGSLEKRFRHDLLSLIERGAGVVAAVSGGPDSVALLYLLLAVKDELGLHLVVAHLDHGLRGAEGERDRLAVETAAEKIGIPFVWDKTDCRRLRRVRSTSIEEAAREARYEFLERVRRQTDSRYIATGHNADDQAESILINLLRGAGPRGLSGMAPVRGAVVRPLLNFYRNEISQYIESKTLSWVEDSSNRDQRLTRNRVRLDLIPKIENDYNPNIKAALIKMAGLFRDEESFWASTIAEAKQAAGFEADREVVFMEAASLARMPRALARRLVRAAVEILDGYVKALGFDHVETVLDLAADPGLKAVDLPRGLRAWSTQNRLCIGHRKPERKISYEYPLPTPGSVEIPEIGLRIQAEIKNRELDLDPGTIGPNRAVLDMDRITPPLNVRSPRPGDRFYPLGMRGGKKISDFFIDAKVPIRERSGTPLVVDGRGEIVWVGGHRPAESAKVHSTTEKLLLLKIEVIRRKTW